MRVILKQEVANLGDAGDIVSVSPGFARNLLIPKGLAVLANQGSVSALDHQKRVAESLRRKLRVVAKELATKLEGTPVSIRRETGDDDKLFG
jgi:large subunit ribosomal protein L9